MRRDIQYMMRWTSIPSESEANILGKMHETRYPRLPVPSERNSGRKIPQKRSTEITTYLLCAQKISQSIQLSRDEHSAMMIGPFVHDFVRGAGNVLGGNRRPSQDRSNGVCRKAVI